MSPPEAAPYETLVAMIERELELAGAGRFEELERVNAERTTLMATLPDVPPACARPALERAALMHKRFAIDLLRGRESMLVAVSELERARRAARGYTPAGHRRPRFSASA
jgi:hypothetical protein